MAAPCQNTQPTTHGIHVHLPNNERIRATHTGNVPLQANLPSAATKAHIFPELHTSLLSIGQLCDHGCIATFSKDKVIIHRHNRIVLTGYRDPQTGLWRIPIDPLPKIPAATPPHLTPSEILEEAYESKHGSPSPRPFGFDMTKFHRANSAYQTKSNTDLIQFLHAACGSPVPSTWIQAIDNGNFATWPGLTSDLVRKHLPKAIATVKGHLNQHRKNVRSTKQHTPELNTSQHDCDMFPPQLQPNKRTHHIYASVIDLTTQISTDLTGRFPVTSSRGNKYVMVLYCYDSNAILTEPMKSRAESEHLRAFNKLHQFLVDRGFRPEFQRLDNEASFEFQRNLRSKNIEYQLAPPPCIDAILRNGQYKHLRIILWPLYAPQTQHFQCTNGMLFFPKLPLHSTSCDPLASTRACPHTHICMEHSILIALHSPLRDVELSFMNDPNNENPGSPMAPKVFMSHPQCLITDAMKSTLSKPDEPAFPKPSSFFPQTASCPKHRPPISQLKLLPISFTPFNTLRQQLLLPKSATSKWLLSNSLPPSLPRPQPAQAFPSRLHHLRGCCHPCFHRHRHLRHPLPPGQHLRGCLHLLQIDNPLPKSPGAHNSPTLYPLLHESSNPTVPSPSPNSPHKNDTSDSHDGTKPIMLPLSAPPTSL